ncbi:TPA: phage tail protein [Yersinia enterocolitica]
MKYLFSDIKNLFFPYSSMEDYKQAGMWPEFGVDVDEDIFTLYTGEPPVGKVRGSIDGMPAWVDVSPQQPLTSDELAAKARIHRDDFIIATDPMMVSDYSIDDISLTEAQRAELTATRAAYRSWPTLENWPLIELPELPQWLLVEAVNQGYRVPVWPPLPA